MGHSVFFWPHSLPSYNLPTNFGESQPRHTCPKGTSYHRAGRDLTGQVSRQLSLVQDLLTEGEMDGEGMNIAQMLAASGHLIYGVFPSPYGNPRGKKRNDFLFLQARTA